LSRFARFDLRLTFQVRDVQAMKKDGGRSFKCADSKEWRTDYTCGTVSDFMAAGESHGPIPAVPKGFVRVVKLSNLDSSAVTKRVPQYVYCGNGTTAPDTSKWTPHCDEFAAKMEKAGAHGGGEKLRKKEAVPSEKKGSVEELASRHPELELDLEDFMFAPDLEPASTSSRGRAAVVSESSEDEAEATADDCVGHSSFPALKCSEHACRRWHHVPADVQKMVRFAAPEHTYARTHTVVAFVRNMC